MRFHRSSTTVLTALMLIGLSPAALAVESDDAWLGGGSDISSAVTVILPQGASIPAIHHIFVDNPSDEPIEVQFRADSPDGISIQPEWQEHTVPARNKITNHFGVEVSATTAAGQYPVVVQLVRSDIEAVPGQITNIPAIQTAFTVEVTGEASTVVILGVSSLTGQPVSGTLVLAARAGDGGGFEIDRLEGALMESTVAPGDYRASFLLGDRVVAAEDFTVQNDQELEVVLEVETVAFVVAAVRPTEENGRPIVVDLVASLNNEIPAIPGPASIQARVTHDGTEVDLVILRDVTELAAGLTEATTQYRPDGGWQPGVYRFTFELTTPDFTLTAADQPILEVPPNSGWDLGGFLATRNTREIIALAAAATLSLLAIERVSRLLIRRRRRHRPPAVANRHPRRVRRTDGDSNGATSAEQRATPTGDSGSWLDRRIGSGAGMSPLAANSRVNANRSLPEGRFSRDQPDGLPKTVPTPLQPTADSPAPSRRNGQNPVAAAGTRRVGADSAPPNNSHSATRGAAGSLRTIQHLHDQGILSPQWSVSDATVVYSAVTSAGFHQALKAAGMTDEDSKRVTARLLRRGLVGRPPLARTKEERMKSPSLAASRS